MGPRVEEWVRQGFGVKLPAYEADPNGRAPRDRAGAEPLLSHLLYAGDILLLANSATQATTMIQMLRGPSREGAGRRRGKLELPLTGHLGEHQMSDTAGKHDLPRGA